MIAKKKIKKTQKNPKKPNKTQKNPKKPTGQGFIKKTRVFSHPAQKHAHCFISLFQILLAKQIH